MCQNQSKHIIEISSDIAIIWCNDNLCTTSYNIHIAKINVLSFKKNVKKKNSKLKKRC
jgi:hypothetical protein